jgi:hypothetical protein|tara:strand:- start:30 stop:380 length:351 start_codon:yes stop_codon:yes gene_type:complete
MKYVKIIVVFVLIYSVYIGLSKFMDTSVDVAKNVTELENLENTNKLKSKEVVGLMMFLGNPPEMKEHLLTKHIDDCSFKKELAEMNSNAMYKCILVDAEVKDEKIVRVLKEIEVLE